MLDAYKFEKIFQGGRFFYPGRLFHSRRYKVFRMIFNEC